MQIYYDNLLTEFCSKDELRPGMMEPKTEGGYTYSSDAHIFVEIPNHLLSQTYPGHEKSPDFQMALGPILFSPRRSTPLLIDKDGLKTFFEKNRTIVEHEQEECEKCEGEGYIECKCCHHENECSECDGEGIVNGLPTGRRLIPGRVKVKLGKGYFAAHLLEIIVNASADQPLYFVNKPDALKAALFQFGEIHCGQMPVLTDGEDDSLCFVHPTN